MKDSKQNKPIYLIGVDGGGTKTKLIITNGKGKILSHTITGPSNITRSIDQAWKSITKGIEYLIKDYNIDIKNAEFKLGLGVAGAEYNEVKSDFLKIKNDYIPYINNITLESDAHAACLGIHKGKPGAIIIVGTGTQGYQIEQDFSTTKIACWGSPVDDQGGGAWIGLEAIRHTFKCIDGRKNPGLMSGLIFSKFNNTLDDFVIWANKASTSEYASLTKEVIQAATHKDPAAINLLERSAKEIELIIKTLKNKQKSKTPYPLSIIGGMTQFIAPYLNKDITSRVIERKNPHDICEGAILMINSPYAKTYP